MAFLKEEILKIRKQVMEKDFSRMNDRQRQAVFTTEGPLLVLAGAGSGKTTVLVNRIANLVRYGKAYESSFVQDTLTDEDVECCKAFLLGGELPDLVRARLSVSACPPWKVMAITFTNKAAGELKERLCSMLGEDGNDIWASTFHSSCARILRRDGDRLGYTSHFSIYDSDDSKRLMQEAMFRLYGERCASVFLEVDGANEAALHLYRSLRFQQVGERKGYYRQSEKDGTALVMRADLG